MAFASGMDGNVTWAAGYDTGVYSFEVTDEVDTEGYVNWDSVDDYETTLTGAKRWRVTITAHLDDATAIPALGASGAATLRCFSATQTWRGTIILQSITNMVAMTATALELTMNCVGSGTLTHPDGT